MTQESKHCEGPCGQTKAASEFGTRKLANGLRGLVPKCKLCLKNERGPTSCVVCGCAKDGKFQFRRTSRFPNGDACLDCRELPLPGELSQKCSRCGKQKFEGCFAVLPSGIRRRGCIRCNNVPASPETARLRAVAAAIRALCVDDMALPWDRLSEPGAGCQRLFGGDSYHDDVRECGATPSVPVELPYSDGNLKTRMRLCGDCEKDEAAIWQVQRLEDGSKVGLPQAL
jgi:hypothetical protein